MSRQQETKFYIGQIIYHKLSHYRGLVIDVDFQFLGGDAWYQKIALDQPNKKQPWYHILVDNTSHRHYAPENQLVNSTVTTAINNPLVELYFSEFDHGSYQFRLVKN
ncbi:MAG: heat shock protein HspQ [Methylococcaceae bacterium]|nr:heat shock protein HspQ [Methylococcaceae bacterium]